MKSVVVLALLATCMAYDDKYDQLDHTPLMKNTRLLRTYAHCFLDKGSCSPDAKEFKALIPDAVQTTCSHCSKKQKIMIRDVIKALQQRLPEEWRQLLQKHDPRNERKQELDRFLAEH